MNMRLSISWRPVKHDEESVAPELLLAIALRLTGKLG